MAVRAASRRTVLSGLIAAAAVHRSAEAQTFDADVAIVGAGAAGLAAARALTTAGRRVVLVEARDRIGGRAYTDVTLGAPFDAGAHYIHWAERNPWRAIATRLGARIAPDPPFMPPVAYVGGLRASDADRQRRRAAFGRIGSVLALGGGPDRSFADAARPAGEEMVSAATAITRLSLGEEPERVSLADYEQLWAGDDDVPAEGYGALVVRANADLPVRLRTPVERLRWDGPGIVLDTAAGSLTARAALVTVPVGVLKGGAIRFTPDLPLSTAAALDGLSMGAYTKVALRLDPDALGPVEARDLYATDASQDGRPGPMVSVELFPDDAPLALLLYGGDYGRALCEGGEAAAVDEATGRLAAMLGSRARAAVRGGRLAGWWSDPWSQGSYSIVRPGALAAREALRTPLGDRVWIAGEATAGGGAMTVGGATLEGERAAAEIHRRLSV